VNSEKNPMPRDAAQMVILKEDRMALMFGGQMGQKLYGDIWQYNVNSNMWNQLTLSQTNS